MPLRRFVQRRASHAESADRADPAGVAAPAPSSRWYGVWAPLVAVAVWVVLAIRTPTNTFHFAPIVVAVVWPIVRRVGSGTALPGRESVLVAVSGTALAVTVGVVLSATGNLEGPTFWGDGAGVFGALFEVVLFAVAGGLFGYRVASRERAGLVF